MGSQRLALSCHLNGACELRADLERRFAGSRPDDVQIRGVSCLGRCDHAPAVSINDQIFTGVTAAQAEQIARGAIRGENIQEPHPEQARIACKADPYGDGEKYGIARKLVQSRAWDDVLAQRKAATVLHRALNAAKNELAAGVRDAPQLQTLLQRTLGKEPLAAVDYAEIVDAESFEPVVRVSKACYVLLAVFIGKTHLIDNLYVEPKSPGFDELVFQL